MVLSRCAGNADATPGMVKFRHIDTSFRSVQHVHAVTVLRFKEFIERISTRLVDGRASAVAPNLVQAHLFAEQDCENNIVGGGTCMCFVEPMSLIQLCSCCSLHLLA